MLFTPHIVDSLCW